MSEEFSRRVDIHLFKDEPPTQFAFGEGMTAEDMQASVQRQIAKFQPYRWNAVAMNNEILCHGESYHNLADVLSVVTLLFGDDSTLYWMPEFGEERGMELLRYGSTDRRRQSGITVSPEEQP